MSKITTIGTQVDTDEIKIGDTLTLSSTLFKGHIEVTVVEFEGEAGIKLPWADVLSVYDLDEKDLKIESHTTIDRTSLNIHGEIKNGNLTVILDLPSGAERTLYNGAAVDGYRAETITLADFEG